MLKAGLHLKGVKSGLGNGTECISLTSTPPSFSGGPVWVLHTCSHTHCLVFFKRSIYTLLLCLIYDKLSWTNINNRTKGTGTNI